MRKILNIWRFWLFLGPNQKKFGDGRNSLSQISWNFPNDHSQHVICSVSFHLCSQLDGLNSGSAASQLLCLWDPMGRAVLCFLLVSLRNSERPVTININSHLFLSLESNVQPLLISIALKLCCHLNSELKHLGRKNLGLPHHYMTSNVHLGGI